MFFSILNKITLIFQIQNATPADSGEYACIATSELGSVITKATLTVLGKVFSVKHYEVITRRLISYVGDMKKYQIFAKKNLKLAYSHIKY